MSIGDMKVCTSFFSCVFSHLISQSEKHMMNETVHWKFAVFFRQFFHQMFDWFFFCTTFCIHLSWHWHLCYYFVRVFHSQWDIRYAKISFNKCYRYWDESGSKGNERNTSTYIKASFFDDTLKWETHLRIIIFIVIIFIIEAWDWRGEIMNHSMSAPMCYNCVTKCLLTHIQNLSFLFVAAFVSHWQQTNGMRWKGVPCTVYQIILYPFHFSIEVCEYYLDIKWTE